MLRIKKDRRDAMAAIDLILLGMIKKQPQSAYELQKNVEYRNISKWIKVSTPAIYKKVLQLEEKGYLWGESVKEGRMPEKTIYRITDMGDKYFRSLMEKTAGQATRVFLDFNAVIMHLDLVSAEEGKALLGRIEEEIVAYRDFLAHMQTERQHIPLRGRTILEQQLSVAQALTDWVEKFEKECEETNEEERKQ